MISSQIDISIQLEKTCAPTHALPAADRESDFLPLRRLCVPVERFLPYRNEVSYTTKKRPDSSGLFGVKHGGFEPPTT